MTSNEFIPSSNHNEEIMIRNKLEFIKLKNFLSWGPKHLEYFFKETGLLTSNDVFAKYNMSRKLISDVDSITREYMHKLGAVKTQDESKIFELIKHFLQPLCQTYENENDIFNKYTFNRDNEFHNLYSDHISADSDNISSSSHRYESFVRNRKLLSKRKFMRYVLQFQEPMYPSLTPMCLPLLVIF